MTRPVLVTGGAGYVGSHCVVELLARGRSVVVVDNLQTGHREAVPAEAAFEEADLADTAALQRILAEHRPEAVMHFAANSLVGESIERPFLYLGDNVRNALNLLEAATAHGVRKLILSSTANLFGAPRRIPITEDEPLEPGSPYGESKLIIERMLAWTERVCDLRYAALRYFNAAGAHPDGAIGEDHRPETHLIPIVLQVALGQRDEVVVFGEDYPTPDGTCVRDYVHVSDLAIAHVLALDALNEERSFRFNLGSGVGYTVREVIETARRVTGHPIPARPGKRRAGDPASLVAGSARIRAELGWKPRLPDLESIVATAWRWHREHPDGFVPSE